MRTLLHLYLLLIAFSFMQSAPVGDESSNHGLQQDEWQEVQDIMAEINVISQRLQGLAPKDIEFHVKNNLNFEAEDILLTKEQALYLLEQIKEEERQQKGGNGRVKRRAIVPPNKRWDLPIRFMFDATHTEESDKQKIRAAYKEIADETCISFQEITERERYNGPFMNITNINRMCASFVGQATTAYGQGQDITLSQTCLENTGTAIHEICHALGIWHEHQREDRDASLNILYSNIGFWFRINFELAPQDNLNIKDYYDYNSVLQYGPMTSSINMMNTIEPLDMLYYQNMGQRIGLSFLDTKALNIMYCSDKCKNSNLYCQHQGYPDPKDCTRCRCPDGLTGRQCEALAPSLSGGSETRACGGDIPVSSYGSIYIESPNYGNSYPLNMQCNWRLTAAKGQVLRLEFHDSFFISSYKSKNMMCNNWVEVNKNSNDFSKPGYRFCGDKRPTAVIYSAGDQMLITFRSLDLVNENGRVGFRALVRSADSIQDKLTQPVYVPTTDTTTESTSTSTTKSPSSTSTTKSPSASASTIISSVPTTQRTTGFPTTVITTRPTSTIPPTTRPVIDYSWSNWSECQGDLYCQCGGCSFQYRQRLCNNNICPEGVNKIEKKPCDRLCDDGDTKLIYIGQIYKLKCSQCCQGFTLDNEGSKCIPSTW